MPKTLTKLRFWGGDLMARTWHGVSLPNGDSLEKMYRILVAAPTRKKAVELLDKFQPMGMSAEHTMRHWVRPIDNAPKEVNRTGLWMARGKTGKFRRVTAYGEWKAWD
jgi:hypothetical protein